MGRIIAQGSLASLPAAVGSDRPEDQPPLRELTVDLAGVRPQVDSAAVPARNAGSPAPTAFVQGQQPIDG